MSLVSQISDVKNDHSGTCCKGPYGYWGKSSKYRLIRCNSCNVVLFMKPEEVKYLEILEHSETLQD